MKTKLYTTIGLLFVSLQVFAAVEIIGVDAVTQNDTESYSYDNSTLYLLPIWEVVGGTVVTNSETVSGTEYSVSIQWNTVGAGSVTFKNSTIVLDALPVTVSAALAAGTIGGAQTVCSTSNPAALTNISSASGGAGPISYQWEYNINSSGWQDISGATGTTYDPISAGLTTIYRRKATSGSASAYSNEVTISSVVPPTHGTMSFIADHWDKASGTISLSGHTGQVDRWEQKPVGGSWSTVTSSAGQTSITYTDLDRTTEFKVFLVNTTCTFPFGSLADTINVTQMNFEGEITGSSVAVGTTNSTTLTLTNYQGSIGGWQESDNGVQWNALSGTSNTHTLTNISVSKLVRAQVVYLGTTSYSNIHAVNWSPAPAADLTKENKFTEDVFLEAQKDQANLDTTLRVTSHTYTDGIGRTKQTVVESISPGSNNMVAFREYDNLGRSIRSYLPYTAASNTDNFYTNTHIDQAAFYNNNGTTIPSDAKPYAEIAYDNSPLQRVLKQGAPGVDWQLAGGNTPEFAYRYNTVNEVRKWNANGVSTAHYPADELFVNELKDENGNKVISYTDQEGKSILKKTEVATNDYLFTYNVYDDYDRLVYTISPEAYEIMSGSFDAEATAVIDLVFKYTYDAKGRLIEKKVPGTEPTFYIYNKYDEVILTQDGNTRANNQWAFVKYDDKKRPVYSGLYTNNTETTRAAMQTLASGYVAPTTSSNKYSNANITLAHYDGNDLYEAEVGIDLVEGFEFFSSETESTEFRIATISHDNTWSGYEETYNDDFPNIEDCEILTINYYDSYDFNKDGTDDYTYDANHLTGMEAVSKKYVRNLPLGSKTRILGTNNWLKNVVFYDEKSRVIQTWSNNQVNAAVEDKTSVKYDFVNQVTETLAEHKGKNNTLKIRNEYVYDLAGRLLTVHQQNNIDPEVLLASYTYNELGQLEKKALHQESGSSTFLQHVDFTYNIRGWLKSINDPDNLATDQYWGMKLFYQDNLSGISQTTAHNGNISAIKWNNGTETKAYAYTYDKMDRLTAASYAEGTGLTSGIDHYKLNSMTYDANGNIKTLSRNAPGGTGAEEVDDLAYTYSGNQLLKVSDSKTADEGFLDGTNTGNDYTYDNMGNMTKDENKGIDLLTYNFLNKVDSIHFSDGRAIKYIYSVSGQKLTMKNYLNGTLEKTTDYIGNAIYEDDALALFGTAEGRVTKNPEDGALEYEYALSDHTGNTRVVVSATDKEETYVAGMEDADYADENQSFYNLDNRDVYPAGTVTGKAALANNANPIGPAIALPVYPGDEIDVSVKALYHDVSGFGTGATNSGDFANAVSSAFGGNASGTETQQATYNLFATLGTALLNAGSNADDQPSAYLNYLVFDKDYTLNTAKSGYIGISAGEDVQHLLASPVISIEEPGFIYVYVSNESNSVNNVYFDDLTLTHDEGKVIQSTDYYPFGLATEDSWTRVYSTPNKFLYNGGAELNEDTKNYETFYRPYDPALGRFTQVDIMASKYSSSTPYNYAFNDPVALNDPNGDDPYSDGSWAQSILDDLGSSGLPGYMRGYGSQRGGIGGAGGFSGSLMDEMHRRTHHNWGMANAAGMKDRAARRNAARELNGQINGFINRAFQSYVGDYSSISFVTGNFMFSNGALSLNPLEAPNLNDIQLPSFQISLSPVSISNTVHNFVTHRNLNNADASDNRPKSNRTLPEPVSDPELDYLRQRLELARTENNRLKKRIARQDSIIRRREEIINTLPRRLIDGFFGVIMTIRGGTWFVTDPVDPSDGTKTKKIY